MAGWSMLADDGFALDCAKSPRKKLSSNCLCVDLKPASKGSDKASEARIEGVEEADKLQCEFEAFLRGFFKEICPQDPFRPLPPMLGDGQRVDLLKLLLVVREKGGNDAISENQSWNTVAKESGLSGSNLASLVKLVYIKYLDSLERWLKRAVENKGWECGLSNRGLSFTGRSIELQAEIKDFSEKVSHKMKKDDEYRHLELASVEVEWNRGEKCVGEEGSSGLDVVDSNTLCNEGEREMTPLDGDGNGVVIDEKKVCLDSSESAVNALDGGKFCDNDEVKSMLAGSDGGKRCNIDGDGLVILDPESTCGKRKRQSLCEMLDWVTGVAKNPCDPAVSSLPEWSKWKSLGKKEMWKQVLLAREAIFLKRRVDSSSDQWQKTQKMHPCLYEYQLAPSYKLRDRSRRGQEVDSEKMSMQTQVRSESPSTTQSNVDKNPGAEGREDGVDSQLLGTSDLSTTDSPLDKYAARCISWRPRFKAEVQEWTGVTSESDPKWLGTRIWPLEKMEQRYLIERDPIGKGRQDSCGCELPVSIECVRFHIAEKRLRVKLELGSAFYHWKFEKMGEEVKLSWTKEQEEKFKGALRSNTPSLQTFFWDQNFKFLPTKSRADLVSYYFNVFLLERRAYQNRFTPNVIYSDDEELESGLVSNATGNEEDRSPSSIFYSPKKPYTKSR